MKGKKIEYWQSKKDNEWYFRVKAGNGKIVGHGGGHKEHVRCLVDISELKEGLIVGPRQSDKDNQWYFHAKALGGEILAQSEGYTRKYGCQRGIKAFRNIVKDAPVIRAVR